MDVVVQGDRESLEWLKRTIEQELGESAGLEPEYAVSSGAFNEAILVSIIVALGGPVIVKSIRDILLRRYEHIEKMRALDIAAGRPPTPQLSLALSDGESERSATLEDIR